MTVSDWELRESQRAAEEEGLSLTDTPYDGDSLINALARTAPLRDPRGYQLPIAQIRADLAHFIQAGLIHSSSPVSHLVERLTLDNVNARRSQTNRPPIDEHQITDKHRAALLDQLSTPGHGDYITDELALQVAAWSQEVSVRVIRIQYGRQTEQFSVGVGSRTITLVQHVQENGYNHWMATSPSSSAAGPSHRPGAGDGSRRQEMISPSMSGADHLVENAPTVSYEWQAAERLSQEIRNSAAHNSYEKLVQTTSNGNPQPWSSMRPEEISPSDLLRRTINRYMSKWDLKPVAHEDLEPLQRAIDSSGRDFPKEKVVKAALILGAKQVLSGLGVRGVTDHEIKWRLDRMSADRQVRDARSLVTFILKKREFELHPIPPLEGISRDSDSADGTVLDLRKLIIDGKGEEEEADGMSASDLIDQLRIYAKKSPRADILDTSGPLGPDLFDLMAARSAPPILRDAQGRERDYRDPSADFSVVFLEKMGMQHTATVADMDPRSWQPREVSYAIAEQRTSEKYRQFLPTGDVRIPPVVHAIWLGGPVRSAGPSAGFWGNFGSAALAGRNHARFVLWTDVPRYDISNALAHDQQPVADAYDADVWEMAHWAVAKDILMVNVHEVFNAHDPMSLHVEFSTETAKQTGLGWAAASDILRLEILHRFGGFYNDGDNRIVNLGEAFGSAIKSDIGFAGLTSTDSRHDVSNSLMIAPARHAIVSAAIEILRENYQKTQIELYTEKYGKMIYALEPEAWIGSDRLDHRRRSVMSRTGPDSIAMVKNRLNLKHDIPSVYGVQINSDRSWIAEQGQRPRHLVRRPGETVEFTARVVHSMIRSLYNRSGDLHLTAIDEAIRQHATPDVIWRAAFQFIAGHDGLRPLIRGVTQERKVFGTGETSRVDLPADIRPMLRVFDPASGRTPPIGDPQGWWLGERSQPAQLVAPASMTSAETVGLSFARRSGVRSGLSGGLTDGIRARSQQPVAPNGSDITHIGPSRSSLLRHADTPGAAASRGGEPGLPDYPEGAKILREMELRQRRWSKQPDTPQPPGSPETDISNSRATRSEADLFVTALTAAHTLMPAQHRPALNLDGGLIPDHITDFTQLDTPTQHLLILTHHVLHYPHDREGAQQLIHRLTQTQTDHAPRPRLAGGAGRGVKIPDSVLVAAIRKYYTENPNEHGMPPMGRRGTVSVVVGDHEHSVDLGEVLRTFAYKGRSNPSDSLKHELRQFGLHTDEFDGLSHLRPTRGDAVQLDYARAIDQLYKGANPRNARGDLPSKMVSVEIHLPNGGRRDVNIGRHMQWAHRDGLKELPVPELVDAYGRAGFRLEHNTADGKFYLEMASSVSDGPAVGVYQGSSAARVAPAAVAPAGTTRAAGRRSTRAADGAGEGTSHGAVPSQAAGRSLARPTGNDDAGSARHAGVRYGVHDGTVSDIAGLLRGSSTIGTDGRGVLPLGSRTIGSGAADSSHPIPSRAVESAAQGPSGAVVRPTGRRSATEAGGAGEDPSRKRARGEARFTERDVVAALREYYARYPEEYGFIPGRTGERDQGDGKTFITVFVDGRSISVPLNSFMRNFSNQGRSNPQEMLLSELRRHGLRAEQKDGEGKHFLRPLQSEAHQMDLARAIDQVYGGLNATVSQGDRPPVDVKVRLDLPNGAHRIVPLGGHMLSSRYDGIKAPIAELTDAYRRAGFELERNPTNDKYYPHARSSSPLPVHATDTTRMWPSFAEVSAGMSAPGGLRASAQRPGSAAHEADTDRSRAARVPRMQQAAEDHARTQQYMDNLYNTPDHTRDDSDSDSDTDGLFRDTPPVSAAGRLALPPGGRIVRSLRQAPPSGGHIVGPGSTDAPAASSSRTFVPRVQGPGTPVPGRREPATGGERRGMMSGSASPDAVRMLGDRLARHLWAVPPTSHALPSAETSRTVALTGDQDREFLQLLAARPDATLGTALDFVRARYHRDFSATDILRLHSYHHSSGEYQAELFVSGWESSLGTTQGQPGLQWESEPVSGRGQSGDAQSSGPVDWSGLSWPAGGLGFSPTADASGAGYAPDGWSRAPGGEYWHEGGPAGQMARPGGLFDLSWSVGGSGIALPDMVDMFGPQPSASHLTTAGRQVDRYLMEVWNGGGALKEGELEPFLGLLGPDSGRTGTVPDDAAALTALGVDVNRQLLRLSQPRASVSELRNAVSSLSSRSYEVVADAIMWRRRFSGTHPGTGR
ncbi:hypothetical protein ACWGJX_38945 [Streptomyces sp. NPDC054775]